MRFNAAVNRRRGRGANFRRWTLLFTGRRYFFYDELYYAQDDKTQNSYVGSTKDDFLHCCKENEGRIILGVNTIEGSGRCQLEHNDYYSDSSSYSTYGASARMAMSSHFKCPVKNEEFCAKLSRDSFIQSHPGHKPMIVNRGATVDYDY